MLLFLILLSSAGLPLLGLAGPSSDTTQTLEAIRKQYQLPALAIVVARNAEICERAAVGVRKAGDSTLVSSNDRFHIGSCTKSMTATLAATLVDEGKLRWDTTIGEVFPELRGKMNARYEKVTLEQLLNHRGGVPGSPPKLAWLAAWGQGGHANPAALRVHSGRAAQGAGGSPRYEVDLFQPGICHCGCDARKIDRHALGDPHDESPL